MDLLCLDLLNTARPIDKLRSIDPIQDENWRARWAKRRGLPAEILLQAAAPAALDHLRSELQGLMDKLLTGQPFAQADDHLLNRYLSESCQIRVLVRQGGRYEIRTPPTKYDLNWLMAEIAASFAQLLISDPAGRVKICANPDCQWLFFDESRACTRRWCGDSCGNLMKVRRFRQRQRDESSTLPNS